MPGGRLRAEAEAPGRQRARERVTNELGSTSPRPIRETILRRRMSLYLMIRELERRLRVAEEFAVYDWQQGEQEFIQRYGKCVSMRSVDVWRRRGVPLRVLREALRSKSG